MTRRLIRTRSLSSPSGPIIEVDPSTRCTVAPDPAPDRLFERGDGKLKLGTQEAWDQPVVTVADCAAGASVYVYLGTNAGGRKVWELFEIVR